ncbi:MAG: GNAT family N-acetyltransferase [Cyanobacteria bacterium P01_A01_bin.84]
MLSLPRLSTKRLILRPLAITDAVSLQKIASDHRIADTTISVPHPYPDGEASRYILKHTAEKNTTHFAFAIERQSESDLIGIIELHDLETEHFVAELSYWLAAAAWGNGYMSEALPPLLDFGFNTLSLNRIHAYHMVRNSASGKVLQKNGFKLEGLLRQRVSKWGKFEDVKLFSVLRSEWQNNKS